VFEFLTHLQVIGKSFRKVPPSSTLHDGTDTGRSGEWSGACQDVALTLFMAFLLSVRQIRDTLEQTFDWSPDLP